MWWKIKSYLWGGKWLFSAFKLWNGIFHFKNLGEKVHIFQSLKIKIDTYSNDIHSQPCPMPPEWNSDAVRAFWE